MMIPLQKHSEKGVTDRHRQTDRRMDGRTDGRTDRWTDGRTEISVLRAAWLQLKTIVHLFYATSSFVHHFIAKSNWSYGLERTKLGFHLCDLDLWPLTLTFCMDITYVSGNNS